MMVIHHSKRYIIQGLWYRSGICISCVYIYLIVLGSNNQNVDLILV